MFIHPQRSAYTDHLVNLVPQLHLDVLTFTGYPHVSLSKFTKKVQGRSSLLAQRELKGVLFTSLFDSFLNIIGYAVKTVCRTEPVDPLVRALVVVVADPVIKPLAGVGERSEHRVLQKLGPDRLPEPLDLAQGHGMVRSRTDVVDPLAFENLLELGLAPPGRELPAII